MKSSANINESTEYMQLISHLAMQMSGFFKLAAGELREGVKWGLPEWIDLQLHEEIAASTMKIVVHVCVPTVIED
jgi:hypothetical protein